LSFGGWFFNVNFQPGWSVFILQNTLEAIFLRSSALPSIDSLAADSALSEPLRTWAKQISDRDLGWQFDRYARYLLEGTLIPMEAGE